MGKKKSTTTQNTTQTANTDNTSTGSVQKTNPSWVTDALKGFTDQVTGLAGQDPQSFVAPASALQTQAANAASGLGGWQDLNNQAAAGAQAAGAARTGGVGGSSLLSNLDAYQSPYTQDVVDTTLADYGDQAGRTLAAQAASGAKNQALGGSRFGIREAQTSSDLLRGGATLEAGLRDQGFTRAAGLAGQDADRFQQAQIANQGAESNDLMRQLQASGLLGTLANSQGSNARSDIDTQAGLGADMRGIDEQQRQAQLGLLGSVGGLLGQGQFGLMNGVDTTDHSVGTSSGTGTMTGTQTQSGGLLDTIAKAAQTAAAVAALSDARTKTDVETLGYDDAGRRWVAFRYLWDAPDAPRHTGVMAQELLASDPDAVLPGPLGFLMVDYSKVENGPWRHS